MKATKDYSGADIQAMCREAAMTALRRDAGEVSMDDFKKGMEKIGPSITSDLEGWYQSVAQQFR